MVVAPRTRYETLIFSTNEFGVDLDLGIRFGGREERGDKVVYTPATGYRLFNEKTPQFIMGDPFPGVIITYGLKTIYAVKAEYDKKRGEISAKGRVTIEDGQKSYEVKKLIIKIVDRKAEIITSP